MAKGISIYNANIHNDWSLPIGWIGFVPLLFSKSNRLCIAMVRSGGQVWGTGHGGQLAKNAKYNTKYEFHTGD